MELVLSLLVIEGYKQKDPFYPRSLASGPMSLDSLRSRRGRYLSRSRIETFRAFSRPIPVPHEIPGTPSYLLEGIK